MDFITSDLSSRLIDELKAASQVDIAVAYFSPDPAILKRLKAVPHLRLLISNDFQINNPDCLEALHKTGKWVRAILPEVHGGNLHAKVFLVTRRDKSVWAMVGSANFTRSGLNSNQEACIILDSKNPVDQAQIGAVRRWIDNLCDQDLPEIDFELARQVYRSQNWRNSRPYEPKLGTAYWALKPGESGVFWQNWLAESVVSIGWRLLPDSSRMARDDARASYRAALPEHSEPQVNTNVAQILKFTQDMRSDQLIFICGRYDSVGTKDRDVYIYGVARTIEVNGECYFFDANSSWHRCKRHARIQRIEKSLPRSFVIQSLQRGSFVPTIMPLDQKGFRSLEQTLLRELGVVLDV